MIILGTLMILVSSCQKKEKVETVNFPSGVFLTDVPIIRILEGWADSQNFPYEPGWRQEEITKELKQVFKDISGKCYPVLRAEGIRRDFRDLTYIATDVYFVPQIEKQGGEEYMNLYGVILYEEEGFKGESQVVCPYREFGSGVFTARNEPVKISRVSAVKLFKILFAPNSVWEVVLDEGPAGKKASYSLEDKYTYYREFDIDLLPRSLDIKGNLLVILLTGKGESEIFSNKTGQDITSWALNSPGTPFKKLIVISGKLI